MTTPPTADIPKTPIPPEAFEIPVLLAAQTMRACLPDGLKTAMTPDAIADELRALLNHAETRDLDDMMATQARALDSIFLHTATRGIEKGWEDILSIALAAQRQFRANVSMLRQLDRLRERMADQQRKNVMNKLKDRIKDLS